MKNYNNITWEDLRGTVKMSPILGVNAVSSIQMAECLGITTKELVNARSRISKDLKQLGMFTSNIKNLLQQIPDAERLPNSDYSLPLDGGNTEIAVFENPEFGKIRTVNINGEPWLVGKDVAAALEYERTAKAIQDHVDEEDKVLVDGKTQSQFGLELGQRGGWLINESGLYSLVFASKLPGAKKFKRWVTSEVLPSIRKHGAYITSSELEKIMADPETAIKLFTKLKEEKDKREALEKQVASLELENHMLAKKEQTWPEKKIINRLVRMYAHYMCSGNFQSGWKAFYRELYYKKGINLNARPGDGSYIDRVKDGEWDDLISVAASMCESCGIDLSWAVNHTNASAIGGGVE